MNLQISIFFKKDENFQLYRSGNKNYSRIEYRNNKFK